MKPEILRAFDNLTLLSQANGKRFQWADNIAPADPIKGQEISLYQPVFSYHGFAKA